MHEAKAKIVYHLDELPDPFVIAHVISGAKVLIPKRFAKMFLSLEVFTLNPFWMYNGLLNKDEVKLFLECIVRKLAQNADCSLPEGLIRKLAKYILIHAENMALGIALSMYIFEGKKELIQYIMWIMPCLNELRELYKKAYKEPSVDILLEMIDIGLNYAIDPF